MQHNYRHVFRSPEKEWFGRMLCVHAAGIYECDRSYYEENANSNGWYFVCVMHGRGYIGAGDRLYPVSAGTVGLLDLRQPYRLYSDPDDLWKLGWVYFDGSGAEALFEEICGKSCLFESKTDAMEKKLEEMLVCLEKQDPGTELHASSILYGILGDLHAVSCEASNAFAPKAKVPDAIGRVMQYISVNYFRKLTLEELAQIAYLSPYHLLREFKKHMGITPLEYTNLFRLSLAKQRLSMSELTIEEIALSTGFSSHSYFTKRFREAVGMTPESFRKAQNNKKTII